MRSYLHAFVQSAIETFNLKGPIYEFDFQPIEPRGRRASKQDALAELVQPAAHLYEDVETDRLDQLEALPFPDRSARTVICIEALEYAADPQQAVAEMTRILAPGGVLLIAAAAEPRRAGRSRRPQPLSPYQLQRLLQPTEASLVGWQGEEQLPHTVYAVGCKPPMPPAFAAGAGRFLDDFQDRLRSIEASLGLRKRLNRWLFGWAQPAAARRRRREFYNMQFVVDLPVGQQLTHQLLHDAAVDPGIGSRIDLSH